MDKKEAKRRKVMTKQVFVPLRGISIYMRNKPLGNKCMIIVFSSPYEELVYIFDENTTVGRMFIRIVFVPLRGISIYM